MSAGRLLLLPSALAGLAALAWWGLPRTASVRVDAVLGRRTPDRGRARRLDQLLTRSGAVLRRRREVEQERARAVEACAVLAAELRAGRDAPGALQAAAEVALGRTRSALTAAAGAAALGGDVPAVLAGGLIGGGAAAVPELLGGLAACWAVCAGTGAGLADAVERLGEAERARVEQRAAVEVELAGPRATARMLALLPVAGLLMASGLGAQPLAFLLGTVPGRGCLVVGVLLEVAGLRWTSRLAVRACGRPE